MPLRIQRNGEELLGTRITHFELLHMLTLHEHGGIGDRGSRLVCSALQVHRARGYRGAAVLPQEPQGLPCRLCAIRYRPDRLRRTPEAQRDVAGGWGGAGWLNGVGVVCSVTKPHCAEQPHAHRNGSTACPPLVRKLKTQTAHILSFYGTPPPPSGKLSCSCTPQRAQVSAGVGKPRMDSECASGCTWSTARETARLRDSRPCSSQTGQVIQGLC